MSFTNLYYKRAAGTARACYVCYKPTTTVLATINTTDFLYTCPAHLTDPGFATPIKETSNVTQGERGLEPSAEEIAKVKQEWEEKQRKKLEKEKLEKDKDKDKDKDRGKTEKPTADNKDKSTEKAKSAPSGSATPSTPTTPPPTQYTLHRDYFAMRLDEHRRRRQAAQAKELAPRLPSVPMDMPM